MIASNSASDSAGRVPTITVLGAGIGGLATAVALRQKGLGDVTLFEQAEALEAVGAGISLWSNALTALEHLGLGDALGNVGWSSTTSSLRTASGRPLSRALSSGFTARLERSELLRTVLRADLQAALLERLRELSPDGSTVRLGHRCSHLQEDDRQVVLHFEDGSTHRTDLLIAADGVHSVVRRALHPNATRTYSGYTAWRGVVDVPASRSQPGEAWGRGQRFGQLPVSEDQIYWFATSNEPEGMTMASTSSRE